MQEVLQGFMRGRDCAKFYGDHRHRKKSRPTHWRVPEKKLYIYVIMTTQKKNFFLLMNPKQQKLTFK